jgi:processive 1,2-diacylglycerol beta-glucosyltransferase
MDYLKERNVECEVLDTYEYINPILSESVAKGYLISTKFTPAVYGKLYHIAEKRERSNKKLSISTLINAILSKKLTGFLHEYDPDVIVCTHIFAAQIISYLQKKGTIRAKTIGIVTDFTIHPFWEDTDLDCYVTASELLTHQAAKKGIDVNKIAPIGIPIHTKFSKKISAFEARKLLGIKDKTTIFVMSGSMGYGKVETVIQAMDSMDMDFQIISVCGNNKSLKTKIDEMETQKQVYNFGFVNNVDIIMDASDCIVTKPGGLTVSESLAKGIPMILINPIPGQEDRNMEFLLNNGLAMKISDTYPIDEAIYQLLNNDWRRSHLQAMVEKVGRPNATRDLGELIISMAK